MIRRGHFFYDLREVLGDPKLLMGLVVVAGFFVLYIDLNLVYLFALLFAAVLGLRGVIGRRCPRCDAALKEERAEPDKQNAFVLHIVWRCPNDGYEEDEETRGDSGLFGVK